MKKLEKKIGMEVILANAIAEVSEDLLESVVGGCGWAKSNYTPMTPCGIGG